MYRIIGLWNHEEKYHDTPHNIGGQILSELFYKKEFNFLKSSSNLFFSKTRNSQISQASIKDKDQTGEVEFEVILPQTFMNYSGDAFSGVFKVDKKKSPTDNVTDKKNVVVMYDDIALPFGEVKVSFGRGDGGHNGVKDIIKKLGTKDFIRIRIGVCPLDFFGKPRKPKKGDALTKYLTSRTFSRKQRKILQETEKKIESILEDTLRYGYLEVMNKYN